MGKKTPWICQIFFSRKFWLRKFGWIWRVTFGYTHRIEIRKICAKLNEFQIFRWTASLRGSLIFDLTWEQFAHYWNEKRIVLLERVISIIRKKLLHPTTHLLIIIQYKNIVWIILRTHLPLYEDFQCIISRDCCSIISLFLVSIVYSA